jgi:hypothetical protein
MEGCDGQGGEVVSDYTPMVEMNVLLKASSENRNKTDVFPTPLSPISNSLNK